MRSLLQDSKPMTKYVPSKLWVAEAQRAGNTLTDIPKAFWPAAGMIFKRLKDKGNFSSAEIAVMIKWIWRVLYPELANQNAKISLHPYHCIVFSEDFRMWYASNQNRIEGGDTSVWNESCLVTVPALEKVREVLKWNRQLTQD